MAIADSQVLEILFAFVGVWDDAISIYWDKCMSRNVAAHTQSVHNIKNAVVLVNANEILCAAQHNKTNSTATHQ